MFADRARPGRTHVKPCLQAGLTRRQAGRAAGDCRGRRAATTIAARHNTHRRLARLVRSHDPRGLDALLADDAVFISPVVQRPSGQGGHAGHLSAAFQVFINPTFRYVREIRGPSDAMLEFETEIDGILVNGGTSSAGAPTAALPSSRMVRPLKAIQLIHQRMAACWLPPRDRPDAACAQPIRRGQALVPLARKPQPRRPRAGLQGQDGRAGGLARLQGAMGGPPTSCRAKRWSMWILTWPERTHGKQLVGHGLAGARAWRCG